MTDNVESLLLEHLKQFQGGLARIERKQDEAVTRLGRLEVAMAGLRRDVAHAEEGAAEGGVRVDRLAERIERIERRLDLGDAPRPSAR
ncbi:MAG: hypothetical protein CVV14_13060 [Gammaproteobacteria bacterium HGW-Gammaproteobacteria-4]|jgi:septal ring factor EnvC (AmiA/AmiB activator)|nr:MAG: hypothetical protein CVV14_13060 [Gammaproteobacteria bacterium HGW-Gammaproteobacteria-4]